MTLQDLTVSVVHLGVAETIHDGPCLFLDSAESAQNLGRLRLPPCPVIAIGDKNSAVAMLADAVVPDRAEAQHMLNAIEAKPQTAAVIVELLRLLPNLSLANGLIAESLAYAVLQGSREHLDWLSNRLSEPTPQPAGIVRMARNGDCLDVLLDRPLAHNAIDRSMRDDLAAAFQLGALDPEIAVVRLRGVGRTFSLGAELAEFGTTRDPATAHHIRRSTLPALWASECANKLEVHVQGGCVGSGLEIAAFARRVTAEPRAWFQLPEMAMGILPGAGGCVALTHKIGRHKTAQLILSGKRLSAREACDWGIVDAVVDDLPSGDSCPDLG